jgi:hypothetical protein
LIDVGEYISVVHDDSTKTLSSVLTTYKESKNSLIDFEDVSNHSFITYAAFLPSLASSPLQLSSLVDSHIFQICLNDFFLFFIFFVFFVG